MSDYANLEVWKRAHVLTVRLYRETEHFPKTELFALTSQIRRAASSIGANLAEGCGRAGDGDLHRYITIAVGSSSELDYHLLLARDLAYLSNSSAAELREENGEISRMLKGLLQAVKSRLNTQRKVVRTKT